MLLFFLNSKTGGHWYVLIRDKIQIKSIRWTFRFFLNLELIIIRMFTKCHTLGIFSVASLSIFSSVVFQWSACGLLKTFNSSLYCILVHIKQLELPRSSDFDICSHFFQREESQMLWLLLKWGWQDWNYLLSDFDAVVV